MKNCPVPHCETRIDESLVVCSPHWRLIPHSLRARVKDRYAGGAGVGTAAYREAVDAAVESVADRRIPVAA